MSGICYPKMKKAQIVTPAVDEAFKAFLTDTIYLALPLMLVDDTLLPLAPIRPRDLDSSFQSSLNQLDDILNTRIPLYLFLRRNNSVTAITYVPYLSKEPHRAFFLENRHDLVRQLGEEHLSSSLICKEIGEITDARSWAERDEHEQSCTEMEGTLNGGIKDMGHKQNKCRLCDRRMKNPIDDNAVDALKKLYSSGATVQISVDITINTLKLNFFTLLPPEDVTARLPTERPSFTFYRHPSTNILYFIFCSPDSASVQERMKHTMAIPGLVNVHAEDNGVHVDQKIEIHDPADLVFEAKDDRIGKFRSLYLRNATEGTESTYSAMEADKSFFDAVE
ncbi:actin monomer binding protein-like protein [Dothidotthia symphoricarpi CBS 119687]|uniref:Actin monomer binding protein-like protein n=1 Tax=Dothidotthia symphoricarpi CBS 119687 TaxID=1392245 RepID=A0A6A6A215_9PLEO|nr:actin monomer binding protein-like protein [Dothidotthia symphoricarpi CBS 119687]KAF2126022.1 actin monomer binding protein-like protein [Dothidotthia symphoricarpi CBS 119687]